MSEARKILEDVQQGKLSIEDALGQLKSEGIEELGFATIDTDRERRTGIPEVIYGAGKTALQVRDIAERMLEKGVDVFATRITKEMAMNLEVLSKEARYNKAASTVMIRQQEKQKLPGYVAIVAAGTSDLPVAEEAAETADFLGLEVKRMYDVGVAGIHRLFHRLEEIRSARVIIVVAGMEGALASVVAGLVDKPVLAVPTSIGYGSNFNGLSALLAMLNSCSSGVSVVNIDNGFGAACQAALINRL